MASYWTQNDVRLRQARHQPRRFPAYGTELQRRYRAVQSAVPATMSKHPVVLATEIIDNRSLISWSCTWCWSTLCASSACDTVSARLSICRAYHKGRDVLRLLMRSAKVRTSSSWYRSDTAGKGINKRCTNLAHACCFKYIKHLSCLLYCFVSHQRHSTLVPVPLQHHCSALSCVSAHCLAILAELT